MQEGMDRHANNWIFAKGLGWQSLAYASRSGVCGALGLTARPCPVCVALVLLS